MTLDSTTSKVQYTQSGTTTAWPVPYKFLDNEDLIVITTVDDVDTTLVLDTDYTVAGAGDDDGGTVTISPAVATGTQVTIYREIDIDQPTELTTAGGWFPKVHEAVFDRLTMIDQQLQEQLDRSVKLAPSTTLDPDTVVEELFEARDDAQTAASEAEASAIRAELAATTVDYYNHEGTLTAGQDTITLPWAYDTSVGVEVFLSGVKQTESSLVFTDAFTVTLDTPVSADTPFEVVASSGARSDLSSTLAGPGGSSLVGFLQAGTGASARTVQAKLRDVVSVKDFGAKGDGVTDDTAAIQAAIDSTPVTGFYSGSKVLFPGGYYRISSPIIIPHENIYLVGEGADVSVIRALETFPTNEFLIRASETASDSAPIRRWGVSRMMLDGRNLADGIGVINASLIDFDRLIIRAVRDGIVIKPTVPPTDITKFQPGGPYITNCRLNASRNQIYLDYTTQVWIEGCWFVGSGSEHIIISRGDKTKIINNEFNNWGGEAAILLTSDNTSFRAEKNIILGNTFYNSGVGHAVKEVGESRYNNIQGNSSWAGESFTVIGTGSICGNNQGTTVEIREVVERSGYTTSGHRKYSDGWAEAWLAADVNSNITAAQDFALPVNFLTTSAVRAIVSISAQSGDSAPMNAVSNCTGVCLGSSVRIRFNAAQGAGTIGIRVLVSGFTQ